MGGNDERTFGSGEVALAAGIPRATFDAWLLRKYLPLPPGPGTGRSRRYSLLDATRIAVAAELSRLSIAASIAAAASSQIDTTMIEPDQGRPRTALILVPWPATQGSKLPSRAPMVFVAPFRTLADIGERLGASGAADGSVKAFVMVDVTAIAMTTKTILEDPLTRHRAAIEVESHWGGDTGEKVWVMVQDPSVPERKKSKSGSATTPARKKRPKSAK